MRKFGYSKLVSIVIIVFFLWSNIAMGMSARKHILRTPLMNSSSSSDEQRKRARSIAGTLADQSAGEKGRSGHGTDHAFVPIASGEAVLAEGEIKAARLLQDFLKSAQLVGLTFTEEDALRGLTGWKKIFKTAISEGFRKYGNKTFLKNEGLIHEVGLLYTRLHQAVVERTGGEEEHILRIQEIARKLNELIASTAKAQLQPAVDEILEDKEIKLFETRVDWEKDNRLAKISIINPRNPGNIWVFRIYNWGSVERPRVLVSRFEEYGGRSVRSTCAATQTEEPSKLPGIVRTFLESMKEFPNFGKMLEAAMTKKTFAFAAMQGQSPADVVIAHLQKAANIILEHEDIIFLNPQIEWKDDNRRVEVTIADPNDPENTWMLRIFSPVIDMVYSCFTVSRVKRRGNETTHIDIVAEDITDLSELPGIVREFLEQETKRPELEEWIRVARERNLAAEATEIIQQAKGLRTTI